MFNPIPNHVQQALARLVTQYKNSTNLQNLLSALIGPIQGIESALTDMNSLRYMAEAQGVQLDVIGIIVGLTRSGGQSDSSYRLALQGQIKINISQGQPEQIIQAYKLFTGSPFVILDEYHNASFILESDFTPSSQAEADQLILTIKQAAPVGVRIDELICFDPTEAFAYAGSMPGKGYDDGTGLVGGKYPAAFQYIGPGFAYAGNDPTGMGYGSDRDPLAGGAYL